MADGLTEVTVADSGDGNFVQNVTGKTHHFLSDASVEKGGQDKGPTPYELLLAALGSCTSITIRMYAERKGWPLEGVEVVVTHHKLKAADYPEYSGSSDSVNTFRQEITFHGPLTDEQRQRLLEIAGRCPVHRILEQPNFFVEVLADAETDGA